MSFGGKPNIPTKAPKTAGLDAGDVSTNQQAVPVAWWIGPRPCPLTWIVDKVFNEHSNEIRTKAAKGKSSVTGYEYFGDVAGIAGLGVARRITKFESDNEVVWEGSITRPDNPLHPDYWRAHIVTKVGDVYVYWGRPDQPVDDVLLGPLGVADATLAHPAYRNQVVVVLMNYRLSDSGTVPNTRIFLDRAPAPALGTFDPEDSVQGESIVAGELELLTSPIFGAALPVARFTAAEWEGVSADVIGRVGCHAPFLDRARPLRDVIRDLQGYYDGWVRLENGKFRPGCFPHDGTVPAGLTELSVHDFTERPRTNAGAPSETVNDVLVIYRDGADLFKEKTASGSDSANVEARRAHEPKQIEMPGIITADQAQAFAAEAAATGAEGDWSGEIRVRRPRAVWADNSPLRAGDNFNLDLIEPAVDQVSRITRRVDYYDGPPLLEIQAEHGVYPSPYVPPADIRPDAGKIVPLEIDEARVLELPPAISGTPLGIPVALLAKRPKSQFTGAALNGGNVLGFNVWYSLDGGSYDLLGAMPGWGMRGVVRVALADSNADVVVKLTLDADNLDLGRLAAQGSEAQLNDTLLIAIGEELFSVGAISIAGLDYDLSCKRVRSGSLQSAHILGAEAWLVYRDELRTFTHKRFVEDQDRYFKLQPYTAQAILELVDVDPLVYHFRDRAPELPVIVLNALGGTLKVGRSYYTSGTISDVNGDLTHYQVTAARMVAGLIDSEFTIDSGPVPPDARAFHVFRAPFVFPLDGTWRIYVKAYDETGGFTEEHTADLTVALNEGDYGPDDGVTPNIGTGVTLTPGLGVIFGDWTNPSNTPILWTEVFIASTAVQPALPSIQALAPQNFFALDKLAASTTRYFWFRWKGRNGRFSAVDGPYSVTTRAGVNLSDIIPGMTLVEIVTSLPGSGNFNGRTVVLTTNGKLYRYNSGAWTAAVPATDLTGQITTTQITDDAVTTPKLVAGAVTTGKISAGAVTATELAADSVIAGKLAAGAVTVYAVGANLIIANTANIDNAVITGVKIANAEIATAHLQDLAATTGKIADLAVETLKIGDNAVTVPVSASTSGSQSVSGSGGTQIMQSVTIDTIGSEPVALFASFQFNPVDNYTYWFRFKCDGSEIYVVQYKAPVIGADHDCLFTTHVPGAGTHTYDFEVTQISSGSSTNFSKREMLALSTKK